jgi:hypothetical protein
MNYSIDEIVASTKLITLRLIYRGFLLLQHLSFIYTTPLISLCDSAPLRETKNLRVKHNAKPL